MKMSLFISNAIDWLIQDFQLDPNKQYELVSSYGGCEQESIDYVDKNLSIKNNCIAHPQLFPAFYIREKVETIDEDQPICSVCLDPVRNHISNQHFQGCTHLLCIYCFNHQSIVVCPECRRPLRGN